MECTFCRVAHYLLQLAYTPEGTAALVKHPQDRSAAVRGSVEKLGGIGWVGYIRICLSDMHDDLGHLNLGCVRGKYPADRTCCSVHPHRPIDSLCVDCCLD